jgi:hypothetical protein
MTEADKILKMIETVGPADTETMDEIDARVWCYLDGCVFAAVKHDRIFALHPKNQTEDEIFNGVCTLRYTRSLDASHAIETRGVYIWVRRWAMSNIQYYYPECELYGSMIITDWEKARCATEYLAYLHGKIQFIKHERENNE